MIFPDNRLTWNLDHFDITADLLDSLVEALTGIDEEEEVYYEHSADFKF